MKSNRNLYNIISSLDPAEKAYFRKYAKRHIIGEKNIYLRLFDEINKIKQRENYNEPSLRNKIRKHSRIGNFSVLKSYLYDMILKSMRAYNSANNIDEIIHNDIADSRFLLKKNLLSESFEAVKRAKKNAYRFERFDRLFDIIKREAALVKKSEPGNVEKIEKLYGELKETASKIKNNTEYVYLNNLVISSSSRYGVTDINELKTKFEDILNNYLLKDTSHAETFYSLIYFYQIHSYYHFISGHYDEALSFFEKMIALYESKPDMIKENSAGYVKLLQNCFDMCDILNRDNDYRYYYNKFTGIINSKSVVIPENLKWSVLSRTFILEIKKYTNRGDFNEEKPQIKTLKKEFEENMNKFPPEDRLILIFQFIMYYFGCGNYSESLKWLNIIINKDEELRRDLRIESRLLFLIIHYELRNFDLLEYAVKSTYRYLRKMETPKGIEPLILLFIRKMGNVSSSRELTDLFIELKDTILQNSEIFKEYGFNYLAWVESKISGLSYKEVIRNNYKKSKENIELRMSEA